MLILSVIKKPSVEGYEGSYSIETTSILVLLTSLFVWVMSFPKRLLFLQVKIVLMNLLRQFLKSISILKK